MAAARDNGVCGVGVAYDSKIAGELLVIALYILLLLLTRLEGLV